MILYPIMVNIEDRLVTVIGAGEVALRKVQDLLDARAKVRVVAPKFHENFPSLQQAVGEYLECIERNYEKGDIKGSTLVFSATDDPKVNKAVFEDASELNILINAVDDPPNCSFFVPSFVRKGDFIMALSTSGASPAFAARMRRELEDHLPQGLEEALEGLREIRDMLKNDADFEQLDAFERGKLLSKIANSDSMLDMLITAKQDESVKDYLKFIMVDILG